MLNRTICATLYLGCVSACLVLAGCPVQYAMEIQVNGEGSVALSPAGGRYGEGTAVTLAASPHAGWEFCYWQGAITGEANPATIVMNGAANVTAVFTTTETVMLPGNVPLVLVWCPAGTFMMGTLEEETSLNSDQFPRHPVTLAEGFWIGKVEVTQAQWQAVMGENPAHFTGNINRPVERVSWNDIRGLDGFLANLNVATGRNFRLPTEAEWEYACRAGTTTRFYWGEDPDLEQIVDYAWHWENDAVTTYVGAQKLPNAFGLYDMCGNVYEWCEDDYHSDYTGAPADGSAWIDSPRGARRAVRGSGFSTYNWACTSAYRFDYTPARIEPSFGLRVAE